MRNCLLALLVACGGGHGAQPDAAAAVDASRDAISADAATRLQLANGGVQLLVTGSATGFQITPADLATDSDVIEIHQEYYGVPWDEFAAGQAPPAAWKATMDAIAASAHATGKPIFLSVSMLDGTRTTLAPKPGNVSWAAHCYDFASDGSAATAAPRRTSRRTTPTSRG
jgi:hypothetical protein